MKKIESSKRNFAWYILDGEEVILTNFGYGNGGWECEIEKFRSVEPFASNNSNFVYRIKDIERAGIEITPEDVCLCYDDCYAGCWNGAEEIKNKRIKNFENEEHYVEEYVTSAYWNEE